MSEDKPKIRLHRYERILAVKWPSDKHWLMIWPDPYPDLAPPGKSPAQTEWSRLARDDDLDGHDWIDSAADHHRDLTRLTAAIRAELDSAARTIRSPSSEQEILVRYRSSGYVRCRARGPLRHRYGYRGSQMTDAGRGPGADTKSQGRSRGETGMVGEEARTSPSSAPGRTVTIAQGGAR